MCIAIENSLKEVYGDFRVLFYSPQVMSFQGGDDPIDGVAVFDDEWLLSFSVLTECHIYLY